MQIKEYHKMFSVENDHFWYRGMRKIIEKLLDKYLIKRINNNILDAGCGTGANIFFLKKYGDVWGMDMSSEAIKFCKKRGLKNLTIGSIEKLPYKSDFFDVVTCFEVLYHKNVHSEPKALKEFYRVLKPGGILITREPAYNWLYSYHDSAVHGKKRYEKKELLKYVKEAGFDIFKASFINMILFPIALIMRLGQKKNYSSGKQSDVHRINFIINQLLYLPLLIESFLITNLNLPCGLSIILLSRK